MISTLKMSTERVTINGTYSVSDYDEYDMSGDTDIFEHVVEKLMLEKYNHDPETVAYIQSLDKHNKRLAILSLMDSDNVMWNNLREMMRGNITSRVDHLKEVIKVIRQYIKIADVERKRHGEIMTPLDELARPMVDLVPEDFWKNPDHKILDSSAGIGTFLIICATKLMNGLKSWEPDDEKRFKHIVENMLYYGELQARNAFLWLSIIDPRDDYKTNTYCGSFLDNMFDYHREHVWGVDKFDLIIQNPPYQEHKDGFSKSKPMWNLFVKKSITLLKEDKFMIMVHPSGWRNVDGDFKDVQNILKSGQMLYLSINNEKAGLKIFGAETRYDFYCFKNKKCNGYITTIKCQDGEINKADISKMDFIPNGGFDEVIKLMGSPHEDRVSILYSRSSYGTDKSNMSREKNDKFKYPCVYTVAKGDKVNLFYSSVKKPDHFGIPKLIWSNGRIISVGSFLDKTGEYGLTQFSYGIIIDDISNSEQMKMVFDSDRFRKLMELCAVGDMTINRKAISTFKKDFWKEFIK